MKKISNVILIILFIFICTSCKKTSTTFDVTTYGNPDITSVELDGLSSTSFTKEEVLNGNFYLSLSDDYYIPFVKTIVLNENDEIKKYEAENQTYLTLNHNKSNSILHDFDFYMISKSHTDSLQPILYASLQRMNGDYKYYCSIYSLKRYNDNSDSDAIATFYFNELADWRISRDYLLHIIFDIK